MSVDELVASAARARRARERWADAGLGRRVAIVERVGARLVASRDALAGALVCDGFSTELAEYWASWIAAAGHPPKLRAEAGVLARRLDARAGGEVVVRRADGVVLLDPPSNAAAINTAPLLSILLPGNAVLVRTTGSRGQALIVDQVVRPALAEAGFDPDLVTLIVGASRDVSACLVPARSIDSIVFFGGELAGAALAREALAHGVKLVAELGGSDHMAVWRDADLASAAASAQRAWHVSTQPCLVPKHLLVHGDVFEAFLGRLLAELPRHGRTIEADRAAGRLVPVGRVEQFAAAFGELAALGTVHAGGHRMRADGVRDEAGRYVAPTVVEVPAETVAARPLLAFTTEIAFPLLPVVRFRGDDERVLAQMSAIMAASPFGLRASVWTRAPAVIGHFARRLDGVGILVFNDDHARAPELAPSWGGPRRSGGPNGECYAYAEKTSRAQAIVVGGAGTEALAAILETLGIESGEST